MSDQVIIALIASLATVWAATVAALAPLLLSIRKHAKTGAKDAAEAREQVKNDHGTNLRDDLDDVMATLAAHGRKLDSHGRAIRSIRTETRDRLKNLESPHKKETAQ